MLGWHSAAVNWPRTGRISADGVSRRRHDGAGRALEEPIRTLRRWNVLEPGSDAPRAPDIGGKARTADLGTAIAAVV